ncbi:MAG: glycosyltransferase [Muribaculaceae bacterium]|nr:glycosyltransferase [Muribaculaceae bacterium]
MKILLLTSIYPIPGIRIPGGTDVCHYFSKEWKNQGHDVMVVNTYTIYPRILHWLGEKFGAAIANIFPVSINTLRPKEPLEFEVDGVPVLLSSTYKRFPKLPFPDKSIHLTADRIFTWLKRKNFRPDIITCHFLHPNIELSKYLKEYFPDTPVGISLHGKISSPNDITTIEKLGNNIDFWGFRSYPIAGSFHKNIKQPDRELYCFSGIPADFIEPSAVDKHNHEGVHKYIFVGNLIHRKHPEAVIKGLAESGINFELEIIGSGQLEEKLKTLTKELKVRDKVIFSGRLSREEVTSRMRDAECLIMISQDETFGLVYLEAMAKGCLVIASKEEGMDGILKSDENGWLVSAGSADELSKQIIKINNLNISEKLTIAQNAIKTASEMTDSIAAQNYMDKLLDFSQSSAK